MKVIEYYCVENNEQTGPYSLDELLQLPIKEETLVWQEGLEDWTEAKNVELIHERLKKTTPPKIPQEKKLPPKPPIILEKPKINEIVNNPVSMEDGKKSKTKFSLWLVGIGAIILFGIIFFVNDQKNSSSNFPVNSSLIVPSEEPASEYALDSTFSEQVPLETES